MLRTVVATSIVFVAACGGNRDTPVPATGPVYSPLVANGLRSIASQCQTARTGEQLQCTGAKGTFEATLEANRFRSLSIALRSMILPEAKSHFTFALKTILGATELDAVIARLEKMETGHTADLVFGTTKVALAAGGTSRIAPEYKIEIRW